VLWFKADREEVVLFEKYGPPYAEWAARVPRFFPVPRALVADARLRGSESPLGSLLSIGVVFFVLVLCVGWAQTGPTIAVGSKLTGKF